MTHDEARRVAVEAAAAALRQNALNGMDIHVRDWADVPDDIREYWTKRARIALDAAEAAMADAGWRMVRDVGDAPDPVDDGHVSTNQWLDQLARQEGWNACRAAMLREAE